MFRYASSTKQSEFRSAYPLSNSQIAYHAPSVMAEAAHESRGERYSFIPTIQVIDALRGEGFEPYEIRQTRVRDAGKREHTKHMVRMRHASQISTKDEVPEVILLNSHDGSSSYQIMSGVFRFVCSNGLIAGDMFNNIRVRHSGNVVDDVIEGATRVLEDAKQIGYRIDEYKGIMLGQDEQQAFAKAALQLRCSCAGVTTPPSPPTGCWPPTATRMSRATSGPPSTACRRTCSRAASPVAAPLAAAPLHALLVASTRTSSSTRRSGRWPTAWPL